MKQPPNLPKPKSLSMLIFAINFKI